MIPDRTVFEDYIFIGNLASEDYWRENRDLGFHKIKNEVLQATINNSDLFMIYLSEKRDLLILGQEIPMDFQKYLNELKICIPKTIIVNYKPNESITERIINDDSALLKIKEYAIQRMGCGHRVYLVPFAVTYQEEELSNLLSIPLRGSGSVTSKILNNKLFVRKLCSQLHIPTPAGGIAKDKQEIEQIGENLFSNFNKLVLKESYGSSGLGMIILSKKDFYELFEYVINKLIKKNTEVIVEGWYEVEESLNKQYFIAHDKIEFLCESKQIINNGLYCGSYFVSNKEENNYFQEGMALLLNKIKELGYEGVVGIDSIVCVTGENYPCIEINARINMSTFIFALKERLKISSNVCHIWEDIIISKDTHFIQVRNLLCDEEFQPTKKKGIICINFFVTSYSSVTKKCRVHFLIAGEEEYINTTKKWLKNRLDIIRKK